MASETLSYPEKCISAFNRLYDLHPCKAHPTDYTSTEKLWQLGNVLDTCATFAARMHESQTTQELSKSDWKDCISKIGKIAKWSLHYFEGHQSNSVYWWDDWEWWGNGLWKVHDNYDIIFPDANSADSTYLDKAEWCWKTITDRSKNVTNSRPVPGGVWNYTGDTGCQNTVTNALYLVLSARLYKSTESKTYLDAASNQLDWFNAWIKKGLLNTCSATGWPSKTNTGYLANERPYSTDGENEPSFTLVPPDGTRVWTGDQGLLMGGLVEISRIKSDKSGTDALALAENIAKAVGTMMFTNPGSILTEVNTFSSSFADDYALGKGALLRYVGDSLPELKSFPTDKLSTTADAAWATWTDHATGNIAFAWAPGDAATKVYDAFKKKWGDHIAGPRLGGGSALVLQASGLDALAATLATK